MDKTDTSSFFKAVNDCDMFIYRKMAEDQDFAKKFRPIEIYNMWVSSRGFSLENEEDLVELIDHIGDVVTIPLFCLSGCLVNDGVFLPDMIPENT